MTFLITPITPDLFKACCSLWGNLMDEIREDAGDSRTAGCVSVYNSVLDYADLVHEDPDSDFLFAVSSTARGVTEALGSIELVPCRSKRTGAPKLCLILHTLFTAPWNLQGIDRSLLPLDRVSGAGTAAIQFAVQFLFSHYPEISPLKKKIELDTVWEAREFYKKFGFVAPKSKEKHDLKLAPVKVINPAHRARLGPLPALVWTVDPRGEGTAVLMDLDEDEEDPGTAVFASRI